MTYQGIIVFRNSHGEIPRLAYFTRASEDLFNSYASGGEIPFKEGGTVLGFRWLEKGVGWTDIYNLGKEMKARYRR